MDEKTIQRIKKLQALAERGVGGEKTTAQKKLAKLLKDNGVNEKDLIAAIKELRKGATVTRLSPSRMASTTSPVSPSPVVSARVPT